LQLAVAVAADLIMAVAAVAEKFDQALHNLFQEFQVLTFWLDLAEEADHGAVVLHLEMELLQQLNGAARLDTKRKVELVVEVSVLQVVRRVLVAVVEIQMQMVSKVVRALPIARIPLVRDPRTP
jgi:uncharacterized membrane protein (DUF373 family)